MAAIMWVVPCLFEQ